jgi:hypothetical protein
MTTGGSNSAVRLICSPYIPDSDLGPAYGLFVLELGQTLLVTELAWVDLCAGWGIERTLLHIDWGFSMTPIANGLSKQYAVNRYPDVIHSFLASMLQLPSGYKHTSPGECRLWDVLRFGSRSQWSS